MIVEAQKVENGLFIPMVDQFKDINQDKVLVEIELIEHNQKELERRHREGYLLKPVEVGEFSDWEDGMKNDCAINLDHIQTVSKGKIGALIIELSSTKLIQLQQALNFALGFSEKIETAPSIIPKL